MVRSKIEQLKLKIKLKTKLKSVFIIKKIIIEI